MNPTPHRNSQNRFLQASVLGLLLIASIPADAADNEAAKLTRGTFYQNPLSYSTTRDPDPPKYVRNASELGIDSLLNVKWLDVGLDYRLRYEYRENDLRRAQGGLDQPLLQRTRAYIGIKDILDPFRFAVELQDSRRENSHYVRDNRDVNEFEFIRAYVELYFKDLFGHDAIGNSRPLSIRYGIHNFEFLDRRLLGNNQWRNTANTFQGFHASLGQESSDWQIDLLAVQPLYRSQYNVDRPVEQQWLYGVIGHWRKWSDIVTLEPYYLALSQSAYAGVAERLVHSPGIRAYGIGIVGSTGFDYDSSFTYQFGQNGANKVRAFATTAEIGYTLASNPWKPRLSFFYGYASGDRNPNDKVDNRFERFNGFGRPWSANDYIVYENISTPKVRVEIKPRHNLRVDFGYSYYWLASATDRFSTANNARDRTGRSGNFLGQEFDIRARYTFDPKTEITVGYAHFQSGGFVERQIGRANTNFAYFELSHRFF
ncbi:alginate export family protein [Prosthecobacter sp.]|uniref:alginate export family protein n=1 Tax=Prosthecobacter sp. TaxID=1965333 RepID=UPI002488BAA3|nr:alginate export family protein [Prosthecobacter sp.]MDI1312998.1 alginate export family protein [Prosthecobacter sp.]